MSTYSHMKMSIKGAIRNRAFRGFTNSETGRELSPREGEEYLLDCLEKGWKYLPLGDCPGFDYMTGCPGHEVEDETEEVNRAG